jgi:hypothetical protein
MVTEDVDLGHDRAVARGDLADSTGAGGLGVLLDPRGLFEPAIVARQIGRDALSKTCVSCDIAGICGGGLYPHRYRSGSGFRNPSVYSRDLYRLITHIRSALREELAAPASSAQE